MQVVQPTYGSTTGFRGMTDIPSVIVLLFHSDTVNIITITYYLAVGAGLAPSIWVVILGMYGTHLKHGQYLILSISIT